MLFAKEEIKMPEVPAAFIHNFQARKILRHAVERFDFEEQVAIYLYCFLGLPISEIAESTKLSENSIVCILTLYAERLSFKIDVFKKAIPYCADDLVPITEVLALES